MEDTNKKLDEIEDFIIRWKKHNKIISLLKQTKLTNICKGEVEIWENQINMYFNQKIKSHL